jgi:PPOX class probable F420-dependent enzyme
MRVMTEEEWKAFLTAEPPRTGKLATIRKDGRPHVAPIWYDLDDDGSSIVFTTGAETLKGKSIRRDPRACLCVDDERPPFSFVIIDGKADISEDLDEMLVWATRIGGRYMGAEHAEAYGRRNAVSGELLVRLRPNHVVAQAAIAD